MDHVRPITGPRPRPYVDPIPPWPKVRRDDKREDEGQDDDAQARDRPPGDRRRRPDDGHIDVRA